MQYRKIKSNNNKTFTGPLYFEPKLYFDERGYFFESWNQKTFNKNIGYNLTFVQDNQSSSKYSVLRGLHYQLEPFSQGKLIRVSEGEIYDVFVDLRKNSSTFSEWGAVKLNGKLNNQLWIPKGFAHGFLTLSKYAIMQYKVTNYWSAGSERTLAWNDKSINIEWIGNKISSSNFIISEKDRAGKTFEELNSKNEFF